MIIRDDAQSLEITLNERGPAGTQAASDLRLNVGVVCPAFSGRNDTAWVQGFDWDRFIEDLQRLDKSRRGEATLTAMSPHDFQLRIFAADKAGHIIAEGWVGRDYYAVQSTVKEHHVSFGIEIDPSILPPLIEQLEALARR